MKVSVTPFFRMGCPGATRLWAPAFRGPPCGVCWLTGLPAIPAALATAGVRSPYDEAQQPDDEHDHGDPPQCLQREARTEEDQSQQQNEKQGNHSYQPPTLRMPGQSKNTRSISLVSPPLSRTLEKV